MNSAFLHISSAKYFAKNIRWVLFAFVVSVIAAMFVLSLSSRSLAANSACGVACGVIFSLTVLSVIYFLSQSFNKAEQHQETKDRAANDIGDIGNKPDDKAERYAEEIAMHDMQLMGLSPQKDKRGIIFYFQGGYFRMTNLDSSIVRVYYPCIYSVSASEQNLLARMLNRVNSSITLVKLTSTRGDDDNILAHAFADILYTSSITYRRDLLRQLLMSFFDAQHALAAGMTAATMHDAVAEQNNRSESMAVDSELAELN